MEETSKVLILQDWAFIKNGALTGRIDGTNECIQTTPIQSYRDWIITTRSGTKYKLGAPHPAYEAAFPGAYQRIHAILERETRREE